MLLCCEVLILVFFRYSQGGNLGLTASPASTWSSDSSLLCRSTSALWRSDRVAVTGGWRVGTVTESVSFDSGYPTQILKVNQATTGGSTSSLVGVGFGTLQHSLQSRVGSTAAMTTMWLSSSSITSQCAHGVGSGWRVSVTTGIYFATMLSAVTYNLPSIAGGTSQSRSISGKWCSNVGGTCNCQGIVSFVGSDGIFSTSVADSTSSLTCSGGSTVACYCFNRPFTGGQSVTVFGSDFGVDDQSPSVSISSSSAEFTRWVSRSSLICKLPTCTDCVVSSSAQAVVVVLAGLASTSYAISVPYGYANATRRVLSSVEIHTPYLFSVPDRFKCPHFWEREGVFDLKSETGMLCRLEYSVGENLTWIIDPCSVSNLCSESVKTDPDTRALLQTILVFTSFETGQSDVITVSSCTSSQCQSAESSILLDRYSGRNLPTPLRGSPYLKIAWSSGQTSNYSMGWSAVWNISFSRKFKIFRLFVTRADASRACDSLDEDGGGWSLASLSSPLEQSTVSGLAGMADLWIGLEGGGQQDSFNWTDGSALLYSNWATGEPNKAGMLGGKGGVCTVFGGSRMGLWRTESCFEKLVFVCSKK